MKVSELMTKNPACVTPEQSVQDAASLMERCDCGCLPVVEGSNGKRVVGVVTDRDIAMRAIAHGHGPDTKVSDVMSADVACCHPDDDISLVQQVMAEQQVRRVPVVDASGCACGMISQADLARAAEDHRGVDEGDVARVVEKVSAATH